MRKLLRTEMEQVHERIYRIENAHIKQSYNAPNVRRRGRVQPREVKVENEQYYGDGFEEEDDWDPIAANKTYGGRFGEGRN